MKSNAASVDHALSRVATRQAPVQPGRRFPPDDVAQANSEPQD
jgi:hypothetical protein